MSDSGNIKCVATNILGRATSIGQLIIEGKQLIFLVEPPVPVNLLLKVSTNILGRATSVGQLIIEGNQLIFLVEPPASVNLSLKVTN